MMMRNIQGMLAVCAMFCCVNLVAGLPAWLKIGPHGQIEIDNAKFAVTHYGKDWKRKSQSDRAVVPDAGFPKKDGNLWNLKGKFLTASGGNFLFDEKLDKISADSVNYLASVTNQEGIYTESLSLQIELQIAGMAGRKVQIDGKDVVFPLDFNTEKWMITTKGGVKDFNLPLMSGRLSVKGDFSLIIQDNRKFNSNTYSVRISFNPAKGEIKDSTLKLAISFAPYQSETIAISAQTNMGFKDEVSDDRKGGWTDQGNENDLRMIKTGKTCLQGVTFDIIEPAKNDGKSCIVLAGPQREYFPKSVEIPVDGKKINHLYLLHALAWAPGEKVVIGTVKVNYQDGKSSQINVTALQDVGNWWAPVQRDNGLIPWTGENKSSYVGLYLSKFDVENKPIKSLTLTSNGTSVWMIPAISASTEDIPLSGYVAPAYIVAGKDWKAMDYPRETEKGSVMDFSFLLESPAGKHGWLQAKGDNLVFEKTPGKPVRFFGVNLCFTANFLAKKDCEILAERLATAGYNTVRFHHFDGGLSDKQSTTSTDLDKNQLDKLEYLFYCLKQKGIYITIDLYISRNLKKGEIPEIKGAVSREFKGLPYILESAMENWKKFSANLLDHVNPYTGIAWKDDPAMISISLINENPLSAVWATTPESKALYEKRFDEWLAQKGLKVTNETKKQLFDMFLTEIYRKGYAEMSSWLRSTGVKALLSDTNMISNIPLAFCRQDFDYVDNHFYWAHPHFIEKPWRLPSSISNNSVLKSMASTPGRLFPSRIFGKPFMITEFNFAYPDFQRAEGGPVTAAYASLQGWNALYRFAYSHNEKHVKEDERSTYFDTSVDPVTMLSDKIALMMFLRGDVKESESAIPFVVSEKYYENPQMRTNFPACAWEVGLSVKTGTVIWKKGASLPKGSIAGIGLEESLSGELGKPFFDAAKEKDAQIMAKLTETGLLKGFDEKKGIYESSTHEIALDKNAKTFMVLTGKSESFVVPDKMEMKGKVLEVKNNGGFAVFSACAVDKKPLAESRRILLLHLTNVQNSKVKFKDGEKMSILEKWGDLPHLARRGTAMIKLKLSMPSPKVWAVDFSGKRLEQIPVQQEGNTISFTADTFLKSGKVTMAYEITGE